MREILFRGQTRRKGEKVWTNGTPVESKWVYGGVLQGIGDFSIIYGCKHPDDDFVLSLEKWSVYTDTLGQFTGLTDKNGERIFEGDILHFDYIGKTRGVEGNGTVVFENGKFGVKWGWHKDFVSLDGFANTTQEVIGNIHDNPELLEVDNE